MAKVLVTGATGTVGSRVVQALLRRGASVRAAARRAPSIDGAEGVALDFESGAGLAEALAGVDAAFLLLPFVQDMRTPTARFVAAALAAELPFALKLSAAGAKPDAALAIAQQHGASDQRLLESGLPSAVLRANFFQENLINFHGETLRQQAAFYGAAPTGAAAYVSAEDIADAAAGLLLAPASHVGRSYDLAGPEALTEASIAQTLAALLGKEVSYRPVSPDAMRQDLLAKGMPDWMTDALVGLEGVKEAGYAAATLGDLAALLDRAPTPMATTLAHHRERLA